MFGDTTGMIVLRIWKVQQETQRFYAEHGIVRSDPAILRVTGIIVESAAIYTGTVIAYIAATAAQSNAQHIISSAVSSQYFTLFDVVS